MICSSVTPVATVRQSDGSVGIVTATGAGKRLLRRFGTAPLELLHEFEPFDATFSCVFVG